MATLIDYLETQMRTFEQKPLNVIDSAIFTQLALINGEKVLPEQALHEKGQVSEYSHEAEFRFYELLRAEDFETMFRGLNPDKLKEILYRVAASPRFRNLVVRDFTSVLDEQKHIQFSATTYICPGFFSYVAFRGTDISIAGWQEDFELMCYQNVAAQRFALEYLESVFPRLSGKIYVGGHSKGGNLALYATLHASDEIQRKIERIYLHDSPGMKPGSVNPARYNNIAHKICRTIPQASVIGMLMDCPIPAQVVECKESALAQHSVTNWQIRGDEFVYVDKVEESSVLLHKVSDKWMARFTDPELKMISDALFAALKSAGVDDARLIFGGDMQLIELISLAHKNSDGPTLQVLEEAIKELTDVIKEVAGNEASEAWAQVMDGLERGKENRKTPEFKQALRKLIDAGAIPLNMFAKTDFKELDAESRDDKPHRVRVFVEDTSAGETDKGRRESQRKQRKATPAEKRQEKAPHQAGAGQVVKNIAGNLGIQFDGSFTSGEQALE